MKATGIVRRIDDLGRVVIPKEIRRTMRIREGDPLEIFTNKDGEVIFKKYSILGDLEEFASSVCETASRAMGKTVAVADRDSIIAIAGGFRRELLGRHLSEELTEIMEGRSIYRFADGEHPVSAVEGGANLFAAIAAPILSEGDALGLVLFISEDPADSAGETEYKLAETLAAFLGRHMES